MLQRRHHAAAGGRRQSGQGDCIDCGICVQVCPTGIDIRDGLQYQCINCGLCIDACDTVMDKVGSPRGLIRFASENELASGRPSSRHWKRPRLAVYATVLGCFTLFGAWTLAERSLLLVDVLRDRSTLAREADDGSIENNYQLQLVNASEQPRRYTVQVAGLEGIRLSQPAQVSLAAASTGTLTLQIRVDAGSADKGAHPITLTVQDEADASIRVTEKTKFWMP